MKIEKLIMACEDMTEVLTLDPKIEADDKSQMRLDLVEAAKLLKTSDMAKLKDQTISVLEKLGVDLPKAEEKEKAGKKEKEKAGKKDKEKEDDNKLDKKKSKKGEKKEGGNKTLRVKEMISEKKYTSSGLADVIDKEFPGTSRAGTMSLISHGQNEKYINVLGKLIVKNKEGVLSFKKG
mgnify:CR=1 FL=1